MADAGTLATDAQILLAIGAGASAAQVLGTNTDFWILMAESEMEIQFDGKGIVTNYGSITAAYKQWLAIVASNRAAWYAINQNQNAWSLSTTQSKLNVLNASWKGFLSDIKANRADIVARMGL